MDKIARLRQEIERRANYSNKLSKEAAEKNLHTTMEANDLLVRQYNSLLSFLDTLSEEPDKSLEEAAEKYQKKARKHIFDNSPIGTSKDAFIAGAEWQASQMPMPEDTVLFQKGVAEGRRLEREDMFGDAEECELYWDGDFLAIDLNMAALGYSERDKVKVIVLKAEEE